jgi:Ser-tRNA(Ala) deacylase AlaX
VVLGVERNGDRSAIVLDRSPFYPKGGGQPSDRGHIAGPWGAFEVESVESRDGVVFHLGSAAQVRPGSADRVSLLVDHELRRLHSRIHSAGELLCAVMRDLGYGYPDWPVTAASHYPERASVQFEGVLPQERRDRLSAQLAVEVNRLIALGHPVRTTVVDRLSEAALLCGYFPNYLPEGQPVRIVTVHGDLGRPCQGTHVGDLSEIGPMEITELKSKKGTTTVSYRVVGMERLVRSL